MTDGATICAREPFAPSSEAVIVQLTAEDAVPKETTAAGYKYFLEQSGVEELFEMIDAKLASKETWVEFVCYYATHDAYPSWFYDLPDRGNA